MAPVPAKARDVKRPILLTLVLVTLTAAAVAARFLFVAPATQRPSVRPVDESDIAQYVGNDTCRSCHESEFLQHQGSHHSRTLLPMTREALGSALPPIGRINNSQFAFVEQSGKFYFEVNPPSMPEKYQLWPIDFAFGSGVSGVSFVSMLDGRNVVEMRMSYFPSEHTWRVTPGQQITNPAAAGNVGNLNQSRHCLSCHIIAMSKNTYVPRREFYGVGCESCHGPGAEHVAAVQSGAKDLKMVDLKRLGAAELNDLCGTCHRTAKDVADDPMRSKMTYRFQPYGLMKSRCFLESGNRLSCDTCHNPHIDVVKDDAVYVKACLSCHSDLLRSQGASAQQADGHGKVCPKNPTGDCIPCHMPKRDVLAAMGQQSGFAMTDHLIAIDRTR